MTSFSELALSEPIQRALKAEKYNEPTPIQAKAIPILLEGNDILACAQTGTGKTAAFCLPLLEKLTTEDFKLQKFEVRSLILTPTRELAQQISDNLRAYSKFLKIKTVQVYGGVKQGPQVSKLRNGADVLVATPGRLIDLMTQGYISLEFCETLILDEADRMFDMGFMKDVKKVVAEVPDERQTLLFSATMPKEIAKLAGSILDNPKEVKVNPVSSTAELIDDKVCFIERRQKKDLLVGLLQQKDFRKVIVFTRTKHGANKLETQLRKSKIKAGAIHGNKSQGQRQKVLREFAGGRVKVLVATDIVARGIDVDKISHVINFDIPVEAESYVHRIGRTARAGKTGEALSLCDENELSELLAIERVLKRQIETASELEGFSEKIAEQFAEVRTKGRGAKKSARRPGGRKPQGRRPSRGRPGGKPNRKSNSEGKKGSGSSSPKRKRTNGASGEARKGSRGRPDSKRKRTNSPKKRGQSKS